MPFTSLKYLLKNMNQYFVLQDPDTGVTTYKDPNDGMVYEYDETKKAWFPKIDNDFMAVYQLNYGFTSDGTPEPTKPAGGMS